MSVNLVVLVGRLGQDPKVTTANSGTTVCKFSVATSKKFKGEEKTAWHNVTCFGKVAENCGKYLAKGRQVALEGELDYQTYTGKDGTEKHRTEVITHVVHFLGLKDGSPTKETPKVKVENFVAEDIPF